MHRISAIFFLILTISVSAFSQTNWMLEESIDRENVWNHPFYNPYNTADKLISAQTDSSLYCVDCNLSALIWKGIESTKIPAYQTDKNAALVLQKVSVLKKKLQALTIDHNPVLSIPELFHQAEILIYRKALTNTPAQLQDLSVEWIALAIPQTDKPVYLYVKAKDCFTFLKTQSCYWVHPFNLAMKSSFADALIQHRYAIKNYRIVTAANLQKSSANTESSLVLVQRLMQENQQSDKVIPSTSDTTLIYLQAICTANIRDIDNRGYYKAHLPEVLIELYTNKKIQGYNYHQAGYFTAIDEQIFRDHLIYEYEQDGEYAVKRADVNMLTDLHVLKTFTKTETSLSLRNNFLLLGLPGNQYKSFNNDFVIAFSYDEVLNALTSQKIYWFNGSNESDSLLLVEALLRQTIAYDKMVIRSAYGDTITTVTNTGTYTNSPNDNTLARLYVGQAGALITDFDAAHKRIPPAGKTKIESYELHYAFNKLANNAEIAGAIIEGIRINKLQAYKDEKLKQLSSGSDVEYLLDKKRFYQTGNAKKDSIYISKISMEERYIHSEQLTAYTLTSSYKIINKKESNTGIAFGIIIPAELNPQYEEEILCYVSYPAMIKYLSWVKTTKKYAAQLKALPTEKAIIQVYDFYDMVRYDRAYLMEAPSDFLPVFIKERCMNFADEQMPEY